MSEKEILEVGKQGVVFRTIAKVTASDYKEMERQQKEQKPSDIPYIIKMKYYPNTQLLDLTQIEYVL